MRRLAILLVLIPFVSVQAEDEWPQFRGPTGQGHALTSGLPVVWSETENIRWKSAIPGEGHSSPVITGNQLWISTAIVETLTDEQKAERLKAIKNSDSLDVVGKLTLQALQLNCDTGKIEQTIDLFEIPSPEPKHALNSFASPTPVIAGDRVFFHFGTYGTAGIDRKTGKVLWRNESLKLEHQNGPGSSPVVWKDRVIVHLDGTNTQSIVAFDATTGSIVWQTKRSGEMDKTPELTKAYCTPLIVDVDGLPIVISPAANWVYGYDARDGREVWKAAYGQLGFSTVPRPVIEGNRVFVATSYMQSRLLAVDFRGQGDITQTNIAWKSDKQIPQKPSMIALDGRLYFVSDKGIVRCLKCETGDEVWFERLPGDYSASPLESDGHLYFFNQTGTCTVLQAGDEFRKVAQNVLDEGFMASPAVSGKAMFVRTLTHVYRIEQQ